MTQELKTTRLQMVIAPSQVQAIDSWRKKQDDLPSRSEAIRRLIDLALRDEAVLDIDDGHSKSSDSLA